MDYRIYNYQSLIQIGQQMQKLLKSISISQVYSTSHFQSHSSRHAQIYRHGTHFRSGSKVNIFAISRKNIQGGPPYKPRFFCGRFLWQIFLKMRFLLFIVFFSFSNCVFRCLPYTLYNLQPIVQGLYYHSRNKNVARSQHY